MLPKTAAGASLRLVVWWWAQQVPRTNRSQPSPPVSRAGRGAHTPTCASCDRRRTATCSTKAFPTTFSTGICLPHRTISSELQSTSGNNVVGHAASCVCHVCARARVRVCVVTVCVYVCARACTRCACACACMYVLRVYVLRMRVCVCARESMHRGRPLCSATRAAFSNPPIGCKSTLTTATLARQRAFPRYDAKPRARLTPGWQTSTTLSLRYPTDMTPSSVNAGSRSQVPWALFARHLPSILREIMSARAPATPQRRSLCHLPDSPFKGAQLVDSRRNLFWSYGCVRTCCASPWFALLLVTRGGNTKAARSSGSPSHGPY